MSYENLIKTNFSMAGLDTYLSSHIFIIPFKSSPYLSLLGKIKGSKIKPIALIYFILTLYWFFTSSVSTYRIGSLKHRWVFNRKLNPFSPIQNFVILAN